MLKMSFSNSNMSPEDDTEIASDEIPITRFPAIASRTEASASIVSPNPRIKKKIRNSGRFGQRLERVIKISGAG